MKTSLLKKKTATLFGLAASLVSLGVCAAVALANPQIVFSDSNFSPSHYTVSSINFGNGGAGSVSFGTGNVLISSTVTPGNSPYSAHVDLAMCKWAKYTPSTQGAISSISWKQTISNTQAQGNVGPMLIIFQGGKYFRSIVSVNSGIPMFLASKSSLTGNDFNEIATGPYSPSTNGGVYPNSHPDFTPSGSVMQFGIGGAKAAGQGQPGSKANGRFTIDDWEVKVVPA